VDQQTIVLGEKFDSYALEVHGASLLEARSVEKSATGAGPSCRYLIGYTANSAASIVMLRGTVIRHQLLLYVGWCRLIVTEFDVVRAGATGNRL